MVDRTKNKRKALGRILLATAAFTGVFSITYLIRFVFLANRDEDGFITATAFAVTMCYGAFAAVILNYTLQVPRGVDDDRSQIIAVMVLVALGTIICGSMHYILGIGNYWIIPAVYYAQSAIMLAICGIALPLYKHKELKLK